MLATNHNHNSNSGSFPLGGRFIGWALLAVRAVVLQFLPMGTRVPLLIFEFTEVRCHTLDITKPRNISECNLTLFQPQSTIKNFSEILFRIQNLKNLQVLMKIQNKKNNVQMIFENFNAHFSNIFFFSLVKIELLRSSKKKSFNFSSCPDMAKIAHVRPHA